MATSIEEVAMNIRYRVELSEVERGELRAMLSGGKHAARKLKRAQILLAADAGVADETIAISLDVGVSTVCRVKRRFVEGGVERALNEEPRPGAARKLTGKEEALLVATACASPPEGRARWTLELLASEMVRLTAHASLARETVRRRLAENALKPWRQKMWCIPRVNGEFVARMEDVLDLYAEAPDPKRPVVCFDESPTQLIGEVRQRIPPEPGQVERFDYEYRRAGTVNLFVLVDAHRPWRKVTVTQQRTALDFARCMRELVEVDHPQAERVRVVLDNLSTHTPGALYEAFPAEEAHRLLRRPEFHFTPKHASWLNMAEIEIGVLKEQCLSRRIADRERLEREIAAWQRGRNAAEAKIEWMFTTEAARTKLGRFYPHPPVADLPGKLSYLLCRGTSGRRLRRRRVAGARAGGARRRPGRPTTREPELAGQGRGRLHARPLRGRLGRGAGPLPAGEALLGLEPAGRPRRHALRLGHVPSDRLRCLPGAAPVHARQARRPPPEAAAAGRARGARDRPGPARDEGGPAALRAAGRGRGHDLARRARLRAAPQPLPRAGQDPPAARGDRGRDRPPAPRRLVPGGPARRHPHLALRRPRDGLSRLRQRYPSVYENWPSMRPRRGCFPEVLS